MAYIGNWHFHIVLQESENTISSLMHFMKTLLGRLTILHWWNLSKISFKHFKGIACSPISHVTLVSFYSRVVSLIPSHEVATIVLR